MGDGGDAARAGKCGDPPNEVVPSQCRGRCGCDDVGAERELGVDACLLIVGGDEDAEVDAEGEQQPEHE